jgi:hypothetical protein
MSQATAEAPKKSKDLQEQERKEELLMKHGGKIRACLLMIFGDGDENESANALRACKRQMRQAGLSIQDMLQPEFGGGPLYVALKQFGTVKMPTGHYVNMTLADVVRIDPLYLLNLEQGGGFRCPNFNSALKGVVSGYTREMLSVYSGHWE